MRATVFAVALNFLLMLNLNDICMRLFYNIAPLCRLKTD